MEKPSDIGGNSSSFQTRSSFWILNETLTPEWDRILQWIVHLPIVHLPIVHLPIVHLPTVHLPTVHLHSTMCKEVCVVK